MALTVAGVGLIIVLIGVLGLIMPSALVGLAERTAGSHAGFLFSIALRAVLGIVFVFAASSTRFPRAIGAIGFLSIGVAVGLVLIGHARMQRFVQRWTEWPAWFVRVSLLAVVGFGSFLVYAAA